MFRKLVISESSMNNMEDVLKIPFDGYHHKECEEEEEVDFSETVEDNDFSEQELLAQMGYGKSEPNIEIEEKHQNQSNDEEEDEDFCGESSLARMGRVKNEPPKHESIISPAAVHNLVSAMKGSREKEGKPTMECRVSWAPYVYDTPTSSDEHFAKTNPERHKNEHGVKGAAGKNRKKSGGKGAGGNESGGGGGNKGSVGGGRKAKVKDKDKKHVKKKHGGSAGKYSNLDEN